MIIHVYAPTENADDGIKDEFYSRLQDVLDRRNVHDMFDHDNRLPFVF